MPKRPRWKRGLTPTNERTLNKWLNRKGYQYTWKRKNLPNDILQDFLNDYNNRADFINEPSDLLILEVEKFILFKLVQYPKWRKLLKLWGITGARFGAMYGYHTPQAFANSPLRPGIIIATLKFIDLHESKTKPL